MSEADQAQKLELEQWEAVNRSRPPLPVFTPGSPGYGPDECAECGTEMPDVRRAMGASMCTECTEITDRLKRHRRGAETA